MSAGGAELGAVVSLASQSPRSARQILGSLPGYAIRIADPDFHKRPSAAAAPTTGRRRAPAPHLAGPAPAAPDKAYIEGVLKMQRDAGATVLLTPTGPIGEADAERTLRKAMRWASATRATGPAEPLLVSLTLSRAWIADESMREVLLNEIVDSSEPNWYLRVRWPASRPASGQLVDPELLEGYRQLAAVMADEGKALLLPQTGLVGWLMGAFGARGFSAGTGRPEQAYTDKIDFRRKGRQPPPIRRYFEPGLLHRVLADTHPRIASQPGYAACGCAYCDGLTRGSPITAPKAWNERDSHHLVAMLARLQGGVPASGRRAHILQAVTAAEALAASAGPLRADDRPLHLAVWRGLLQP